MSDHDTQLDRPLIPGARAPLSPGQLWRMLVARRWVIAAVIALFAAVAVAAALFLPDNYTGSATLVIDLPSNNAAGGGRLTAGLADKYLATQIDLLQSDKVLLRVVKQHHLTDDKQARAAFQAQAGADASFAQWLARRLGQKLDVASGAASRLIRVRFSDASPQRAAAIANAVVRAYQQVSEQVAAGPAKARLKHYTQYLDSLRAKVDTAEHKLTAAQQQSGVLDIDQTGAVGKQRLADLGVKLNKAQADRQAAQAKVARIRKLARQGKPVSAQAEILSSTYVQKLKERLVALQSKRAKLAKTLGDNHPRMRSLAAQIATVRGRLHHEVNAYLESNRGEAETAADREAALQRSLEHEHKHALNEQKKRDDIAKLVRQRNSAREVYQAALGQYDQVLGAGRMPQYNVSVVSWASPPQQPAGLSGKMTVLLALAMGTLAGGALALLLELVDRRIRSAEDITRELGLPVLGELPA